MKIFILGLFISISAFAKPCGLQGTIEERIKDCAQSKGDFALVTLTEKGLEIYKDIKTGLIWGHRILTDFNHYGSQRACTDEISGNKEILDSVKWRLPTVNEFETAASHGMKTSLPHMDYFYWTSTPVKSPRKYRRRRAQPAQVFLWDGREEKTDIGDLKDGASVRCVARD